MPKVEFCKSGQSLCCIRVNSKADVTVRFAAEELSRYLKEITDASVPISSGHKKKLIPIELVVDKSLSDESNGKYDSVQIDVSKDAVRIVGENSRSVLSGVYSLLEEIGCLWTYPRKEHQVVPKKKSLRLGIGRKMISHRLKLRVVCLDQMVRSTREVIPQFIGWMAKNHFNALSTHPGNYGHCEDLWTTDIIRWDEVADIVVPTLKRCGIMLFQNVHTLHHFLPPEKYFKMHPDWYSLQDVSEPRAESNEERLAKYLVRYFEDPTEGKHHAELPDSTKTRPKWLDENGNMRIPAQICYSNNKALNEYAGNVVEYLSQHPEVDVIGLWPRDGGNFCQCSECRKDPYAIFKAIRYVAGRIHRRFPDVLVEHLVYGGPAVYAPPPDDLPGDERMIVFLCCPDEIRLKWGKWLNENQMIGYRGDYVCADNYAQQGMVAVNPDYIKELVDMTINEFGFKGVSSFYIDTDSWWISSLNMWLLAKASLAAPSEMMASIKEYSKKYYGRYAEQADGFFKSIGDAAAIGKLLQKHKRISLDDDRFNLVYTYFGFREKLLSANELRQAARKIASRSRKSALKKMLDVAKLEEQLLAMVQESHWRADGLFNLRFFVSRRWERFEKDEEFCRALRKKL